MYYVYIKSKLHAMGLLPNRGVCLDSFRGLSCSSPPRGTRVRRLVAVSPTPRKRFPCCLQVEKPCKRLAVFCISGRACLRIKLAPIKTFWRGGCVRAAMKSWPHRAGQVPDMRALPFSRHLGKMLLQAWRKTRKSGRPRTGLLKWNFAIVDRRRLIQFSVDIDIS